MAWLICFFLFTLIAGMLKEKEEMTDPLITGIELNFFSKPLSTWGTVSAFMFSVPSVFLYNYLLIFFLFTLFLLYLYFLLLFFFFFNFCNVYTYQDLCVGMFIFSFDKNISSGYSNSDLISAWNEKEFSSRVLLSLFFLFS